MRNPIHNEKNVLKLVEKYMKYSEAEDNSEEEYYMYSQFMANKEFFFRMWKFERNMDNRFQNG